MSSKVIGIVAALLAGLIVLAAGCAPAEEVKPAEFFKGKTIDMSSCVDAGGSSDVITRLVAKKMDERLGTTSVVTTRRGSGGTEGPAWVYKGQPDGLTMGSWVLTAMVMTKINQSAGANFELDKFNWLMAATYEPSTFLVATKGPYQTINALKTAKSIKLAGTSIDGHFALGSMTVAEVLGLDAKVVSGYSGVSGAVLSMEQGETVGTIMPISTSMAAFKAGRIKPLFVMGTKRSSVWPDLPALSELVSMQGQNKVLVEMWDKFYQSFPVFASPGIPQDRVAYLQASAKDIIADPDFRAQVDKISGYRVDTYLTGEEVTQRLQEVVKEAANYKPLFDMLIKKYGTTK